MDKLPAGNFLRKNSPYVIEGEFNKPETVLDVIAESKKIENGIIEIMGPKLGGYLVIKNNSVITDAVVEETRETGTAAVCRLLLMPHGIFSYRKATPTDTPNYAQELNIPFDDAKKFLSGPSSIGLAFPGKTTLHNLKALTGESKLTNPDYQGDGIEEDIEDMEYISADTVSEFKDREDFKRLVDDVGKKQKVTVEMKLKERQTQTNLEALKNPGPLPKRKEKFQVDKKLIAIGIVLVFGVFVGSSVVDLLHNPFKMESATKAVEEVTTPQPVQESATTAKQSSGTAPFALPSSTPNPNPPPNPTPAASTKRKVSSEESGEPNIKPPVSQAEAAPTSVELGNSEINKWLEEVRKNPSSASARRELAQAYLLKGDTSNSIKAFYQVMKLKNVDSTEIISYANNLMVFGNQDLSKQFLRDVLRSDPSRKAIRERLSELH